MGSRDWPFALIFIPVGSAWELEDAFRVKALLNTRCSSPGFLIL